MSAFVISKETMDRVVGALLDFSGNHHRKTICGIERNAPSAGTTLGRALYEMNLDSVLQRYPHDTKETAPGPCNISNIHDHYQHYCRPMPNAAGDYKAVRCLLYQSCEGDVPETSEVYKELARIAYEMAAEIVTNSSAYTQAPWDE